MRHAEQINEREAETATFISIIGAVGLLQKPLIL